MHGDVGIVEKLVEYGQCTCCTDVQCIFAEEFGLFGVLLLMLTYLLIVVRGLVIAFESRSRFGKLLAGTLSLTFFLYIFINMGMTTGILPVVGVPLPLISYGGTAMLTFLVGLGILMSIHSHPRLHE